MIGQAEITDPDQARTLLAHADDILALMDDERFRLPRNGAQDIETWLRDRFAEWQTAAAHLKPGNPLNDEVTASLPQTMNLANRLQDAVRCHLSGVPDIAMQSFDDGLQNVLEYIRHSSTLVEPTALLRLYRVRTGALNERFGRSDLFHIPFEKRDRVNLQRFSFPGLPCLYLSTSLYTCWEEMRRPELATLWVSRLVPKSLRMFTVSRPQDLVDRIRSFRVSAYAKGQGSDHYTLLGIQHLSALIRTAILWPLMASCLMRTRPGTSASFVQEYIIPQMLLAWIVRYQRGFEQKMAKPLDGDLYDGILYPSTRILDGFMGYDRIHNLVVPVRTQSATGQCPTLVSMFEMTEPINWQLAQTLIPASVGKGHQLGRIHAGGRAFSYSHTHFGAMERFLEDAPLEPLT